MADDSWMDEFFTFPPEEDDPGEKDEKIAEEVNDVLMSGCLERWLGQEVDNHVDTALCILPWNSNSSYIQEPPADFNTDSYDASLLFGTESFDLEAPATSAFQSDSLMNIPVTAMPDNDTYGDQMDLDLDSLSVIQSAENCVLFERNPTASQNNFSTSDYGGVAFGTDPLSILSSEFNPAPVMESYDVSATSQFAQFDPGFQFPEAASNHQSLELAPQENTRNAMMSATTAPRRR